MYKFLIPVVTAALALTSEAAFAQTTSQQAVLGASDDAEYSLRVQGNDGVIYNCRPDIVEIDGVRSRQCVRPGQGLFDGGLSGAGIGGGLALVALAIIAGDDDNSTSTTNTGGGGVGNASDSRLKSDIVRVGSTAHGLPLYHFRYTGQSQVWEGVMAQDVQRVMPDAVVTMENGYFGVRYDMLGIEMRAVK